jgi:glutaredoxin
MKNSPFLCAAATLLALASPAANALFKVVGPDGKVTYTDRPPASTEGRAMPVNRETGSASDPALPFALRQVASRFPATLYTSSDCGDACSLARAWLVRRGVPFSERIASSPEEREAWTRIVGGSETPTLQVGGQWLRGFTPAAWEETVEVAGYPRVSLLPASYQAPAAVPLIPPRAPAPAAPPPPPAAAPANNGSNPTGIRF